MDGIIVIDKEKGFTSHDVVAKLRGILRMKKIGHTGTLDPDATGVLPVALGKATRLVEFLTEKEKTYEAVLHLGLHTDTQDITGKILKEKEVICTEDEVREVMQSFLGEQQQIPPMYSALKVGGKKLYELAREGIEIEREARPVHFKEIAILEMQLPMVRFSVTCSKGTYIRTLCHDIGEKLGCGGCMESLKRTASGRFSLEESHTLQEVQQAMEAGTVLEWIVGIEEILEEYPRILSAETGDRLLMNGNPLKKNMVSEHHEEGWVRMCTSLGEFVGIYEWDKAKKGYYPVKMFL